MDKTALHIEKRQYNAALPVWCVYQGDRCLAVCETERRAGEMLRDMEKAKGTAGQLKGRDASGGAIMLPPEDNAPTLSEIGITKRQSSDWQNVEAMRGSYV
jgi:hypothetical protein